MTTPRTKVQGPSRTTLCEARRRSTPGRKRCSSSCTTKTPQGCGHPDWSSRVGLLRGSAAHNGARRRHLPVRADSRCFCASRGGQRDGRFSTRLDRPIAGQVIAVPKISCSSCPSGVVFCEPQMVEQSEKVPTILHFLKQTVDIPVSRRGCAGGSQGFLPGQGSSSSVEQMVHTLAGRGVFGGLQQGFPLDMVR